MTSRAENLEVPLRERFAAVGELDTMVNLKPALGPAPGAAPTRAGERDAASAAPR